MPLTKNAIPINFSQGLDLKTDPNQVQLGKFLTLENSIFDKGGLLQKRNGFGNLPALPNSAQTFTTTLNDNLLTLGPNLYAYAEGPEQWLNKGIYKPLELQTLPIIRSSVSQSQASSAVSDNDLVCVAYTNVIPGGVNYSFAIDDSVTGQNIYPPTLIPAPTGMVTGPAAVFFIDPYFVIVFSTTLSGTHYLQYIAISSSNPTVIHQTGTISNDYTPYSAGQAFAATVYNNIIYFTWNAASGAVKMNSLTSALAPTSFGTVTYAGYSADVMSLTVDASQPTPVIYNSFINSSGNGYTLAVTQTLTPQPGFATPVQWGIAIPFQNITSVATNGVCLVYYEVINTILNVQEPANYIETLTVSKTGVASAATVLVRSVGLASQAFLINASTTKNVYSNLGNFPPATIGLNKLAYAENTGILYQSNGTAWVAYQIPYVLTIYNSIYQPTYFLIDGSDAVFPAPVALKLAYSNGPKAYYTGGLTTPTISNSGTEAQFSYLYADQIEAVNKTQGVANTAGIYAQLGVNLAAVQFGTSNISTSEIAGDLHMSGGFLWMYDGLKPVEHNFFVWPDQVQALSGATIGAMDTAGAPYFYQVTYEWSDNQGNLYRSAPSVPVEVPAVEQTTVTFTALVTAGNTSIAVSSTANLVVGQILTDVTTPGNLATGTYITSIVGSVVGLSAAALGSGISDTLQTTTTGSVDLRIPTLRLTYKILNPVKIVIYRWSTKQQVYYQVTSITDPILNDPTVDYVSYTDTQSDSDILGNNILYTTGGVVEDIQAPASSIITLFQSRLFLVDAEDPNLLWFSKQVIENVPVETSDLLTLYVAPTTGAQGSTGYITALSAMDDKLIIFKNNAIYYINGAGPDNTGANNQFSEPTFVTATVGSVVPNSIVFMPSGLMFQSDKGIWLLGRDLSTSYIGAPVQSLTLNATVLSALNIPATNQVRFTLDSGITLMYDYYYSQWGTFTGVPGISSTLYQSLHTYINSFGQVFQETPGLYVDGSTPTVMSFTTSWLQLSGLQGFQRAYYFYMLANYQSPHKLSISVAYDYEASPTQVTTILPTNYSVPFGTDTLFGSTPTFGGQSDIEQWRVFLQRGKCESFQIAFQEIFDPSYNTAPGAGLTISGLNVVVGQKKGYTTLRPSRSVG
jgi:hypothetical protein